MSLNELFGKVLEADEGESFSVQGIGKMFAKKVKKENASLDTSHGTVTGTVVLDMDGKLGLIGIDTAGKSRVMAHQGGNWQGSTLSLKDAQAKPTMLITGNRGFEKKDLAESVDETKEGQSIIVKDTIANQEKHPDLVGKLGKIVKKYDTKQGLRVAVKIEGEEYNMDWTDVKGREKDLTLK
jgi:hypothetical protein